MSHENLQTLPVIESSSKIIGCSNCIGACCMAGVVMSLSNEEATQLVEAGTQLALQEEAPKRRLLPIIGNILRSNQNDNRNYKLESDCGNLVLNLETGQSICGDYENRPQICRDFKQRSYGCLEIRVARKVETRSDQTIPRSRIEAGETP